MDKLTALIDSPLPIDFFSAKLQPGIFVEVFRSIATAKPAQLLRSFITLMSSLFNRLSEVKTCCLVTEGACIEIFGRILLISRILLCLLREVYREPGMTTQILVNLS